MGLLNGMVAVVTGAGRGIGRAHALALANAGASVVVNDIAVEPKGAEIPAWLADRVAQEIVSAGGTAVPSHDDCASFDGAEQMIAQAARTFGDLHILINNAGILRDRDLCFMSEGDWDEVLRVHGKGYFAPTRFACTFWRQRVAKSRRPTYGRIVHTASESGLYGRECQANYSFAKAGLFGFSSCVAKEMASFGVTSNVIAPRAATRLREMAGQSLFPDDLFDPLDPANVAPWVVYLCSEHAASITGQAFLVYAGVVKLIESPSITATISKNGRWVPEEFVSKAYLLFN